MRSKLLLLACSLLWCSIAYPKDAKRAVHCYNRAMKCRAKRDMDKAIAYMEDAIKADPGYIDAYSNLGEWYFDKQQYQLAANTFRKAMGSCKDGGSFAKPFARSLVYSMQADSALTIIETYQGSSRDKEWSALREKIKLMQQVTAHPWNITVFNMGRVNTISPETCPSISADGEVLYFTRRKNNMDEDFYYALKDSCGGWFTAENMGSPPNTPDQESSQMISADGHYLFFTRCENRSEDGWGQGGCDLYMAYRISEDTGTWSVPESFGATINTPEYEGMPCLSPDNRELYFTSNRPGGYGGFDIWVSKFEDGLWQAPRNLGPKINTPGNETAPFLHVDNKTLYFSSDGLPGMGGKDFFVCSRADVNDTDWGAPRNMGYPINSTADEHSLSVSLDGSKLYFASDRDNAKGFFDLYECIMPGQLRPTPVSYVKGYVYDSLSKDRLNYASINIYDAATGNKIYHFLSNRGDGSYMITLPIGVKYAYQVDRIGYTTINDTIFFEDQHLLHPLRHNISMLPFDYVKPVEDSLVMTIHFPINGTKLSDSDAHTIATIMAPWLNEKGILVYVNGYTDNTGTPMLNEHLSLVRAELVSNEIKKLGIDDLMIKTQGWGEANTLAPNETPEGRDMNRRVEVIIRR